jgi:cytochrome c556
MKNLARSISMLCFALTSVCAHAAFPRPSAAVHYRRAALLVMGHHTSDLGAMLRGRQPYNAAQALNDARVIALLSQLPWGAFGPGTDVAGTQAKPAVWREHARFLQDAQRLQQATPALLAAVQGGKLDQVRVAFIRTVKTCKACHDDFKR